MQLRYVPVKKGTVHLELSFSSLSSAVIYVHQPGTVGLGVVALKAALRNAVFSASRTLKFGNIY